MLANWYGPSFLNLLMTSGSGNGTEKNRFQFNEKRFFRDRINKKNTDLFIILLYISEFSSAYYLQ
jgi:hypothetical protein